jgi:hypothetical protein
MKCWLRDAASCGMERSVRGQEAVTQEPLGALESTTLHESIVMCQEYVLDRPRVIEQKRRARAQPKRDDLIRAQGQLLQEGERVGLPSTEAPEGA